MAKLSVVIPAVDVMVNGVTYRKVDRKAQAGDIIRFTDDHLASYVTNGAFYEVTDLSPGGNPRIIDEDGDRYSTAGDSFEVFAPISEPATGASTDTITFQGATWRRVNRDVREGDAIKFTDEDRDIWLTEAKLYVVNRLDSCDDPQITDDDGDSYDAGGVDYEVYEKVTDSAAQEYREVKRKAAVGERIKITNRVDYEDDYENGAEFIVNSVDRDGDVRVTVGSRDRKLVLLREYVVLEPATAEMTQPTQPERLKVGEYARVVEDQRTSDRDPISSRASVGDIVEVLEDDGSGVPFRVRIVSGANVEHDSAWARPFALVRATDEEVATAKRAALIAQFSVGDYVKLISGGGVYPRYGFSNGDVCTVDEPADSDGDFRIKRTEDGHRGYAQPEQIVKLTAEEVAEIERKQAEEAKWAAIGRKVSEFKRGDIVEVDCPCGALLKSGDLVPVKFDSNESGSVQVTDIGWAVSVRALIVPVEQRFDRTEEVDAA